MDMKQVWAAAGGFFLVFILITLTNKPHVEPHDGSHAGRDKQRAAGDRSLDGQAAEQARPRPASNFQRGVTLLSRGATAMGEPPADAAMAKIAGIGANWVSLNVVLVQPSGDANDVGGDPKLTATPEALAHAVDQAHQQQLRVMVRMLLAAEDGTPREQVAPANPMTWMRSYRRAIAPYLAVAKQHQIELMGLGTGLVRTEKSAPWKDLIREARDGYSGQLTYAAAGGSYKDVPFWSELDLIGVEAFFPVGGSYASAWQGVASEVGGWAATAGKPVIFTAVGLPARAGAGADPGHPDQAAAADPQAPADDAKAFFAAMQGQSWLAGAFWYGWDPSDSSPPNPYDVKDQPAQAALQTAFGGR